MSDKLKSCPFCNNEKVEIIKEDDSYYAQCKCGICTVVCDTEESVRLIWNGKIEWHSVFNHPETDKEIIVMDNKGREYDCHYWAGHRYYEYVGEDGHLSDVDIRKWRYKDSQ